MVTGEPAAGHGDPVGAASDGALVADQPKRAIGATGATKDAREPACCARVTEFAVATRPRAAAACGAVTD